MYEATLRIEPGGPYGEPTADADAVVEVWCNVHCDLLEVRGADAAVVIDAIADHVGVRERVADRRTIVVTEECLKEREWTIEGDLDRHDCLLVPPLRYEDGAKFCRVLAVEASDLAGLYRDLVTEGDVAVENKRTVDRPSLQHPLVDLESVLPTLSPRQRETLVAAYEAGYYEIPRETTTAELASALGIERRTAEDHLRRAENKLVDAMVEHLRTAPRPVQKV